MNKHYKNFLFESEKVSNDLKHRKTIKFNMSKYDAAVEKGKKRYCDLDAAKNTISYRKRLALSELDKYLLMFEENIKKRGVPPPKIMSGNDMSDGNPKKVMVFRVKF